jgi:hypothetical protein
LISSAPNVEGTGPVVLPGSGWREKRLEWLLIILIHISYLTISGSLRSINDRSAACNARIISDEVLHLKPGPRQMAFESSHGTTHDFRRFAIIQI